MDCINLKEQFGDRFKVEYEESYYAQYGEHAWREDPHYMILLCRHGHIYPHGSATLAASISRRGAVSPIEWPAWIASRWFKMVTTASTPLLT